MGNNVGLVDGGTVTFVGLGKEDGLLLITNGDAEFDLGGCLIGFKVVGAGFGRTRWGTRLGAARSGFGRIRWGVATDMEEPLGRRIIAEGFASDVACCGIAATGSFPYMAVSSS